MRALVQTCTPSMVWGMRYEVMTCSFTEDWNGMEWQYMHGSGAILPSVSVMPKQLCFQEQLYFDKKTEFLVCSCGCAVCMYLYWCLSKNDH